MCSSSLPISSTALVDNCGALSQRYSCPSKATTSVRYNRILLACIFLSLFQFYSAGAVNPTGGRSQSLKPEPLSQSGQEQNVRSSILLGDDEEVDETEGFGELPEDVAFVSGEAYDKAIEHRRQQRLRREKFLRNRDVPLTDEDRSYVEESKKHPYRPGRSIWLWRLQFVLVCLFLVAMFAVQSLVDFKARKKLNPASRVSTCLWMGANFRDLGETKLVSAARFITCIFLHGHFVHLFLNLVSMSSAWVHFSSIPQAKDSAVWVFHWTFPIFMLTALAGSAYSYCTTLKSVGFSIGASGGCLGLCTSFVSLAAIVEGLPEHKRRSFAFTFIMIIMACIPWSWFRSNKGGQKNDVGAHVAGTASGIIIALVLGTAEKKQLVSIDRLISIADILSIVLIVITILAYIEIAREYFVDGKELVVRAYVKWINFGESLIEDGRRHTTEGRIDATVLTDEYLLMLENEEIEDPETTFNWIMEQESKRRKSLGDLGNSNDPLGDLRY